MKRLLYILSVVAIAFSQDSTSFKTGYYLTIQDFIKNTPTAPTKPTRVMEGRGESIYVPVTAYNFSTASVDFDQLDATNAYFVMEQEESEYKKVRGESFKGYCDSGRVFLVDNPNPFKGRIMRVVTVGTTYSYYNGIDFQTTSTGFGPGMGGGMKMGGGMNMGAAGGTTSTPVPVLVVINMKTGESTTLQRGMFMKANMKYLLADHPELIKEYKANKNYSLAAAAGYLDRVNAKN